MLSQVFWSLDTSEKWNEDTLCQDYLLAKLNDFTFMFFINCFHSMLSHAVILFDILQCKQLDIKLGQNKLNDLISCIEAYRANERYETSLRDTATAINQADESGPPRKGQGCIVLQNDQFRND